ncbi:MAG: hypothetical protein J6P05_05385 [Lachnospiraceae bacterium]|nr:hypothetical protein [Lachnospiraceae bacterium]
METNLKLSNEIEDACKNLFFEMSEDEEEFDLMMDYFKMELYNMSAKRFTFSELYGVIEDGLDKIGHTMSA